MKLFVYYGSGYIPRKIHAIISFTNDTKTLCSSDSKWKYGYSYVDSYDEKDYLDTTKPFCKTCNKILKKKGIDMKQLAINQKLGVR